MQLSHPALSKQSVREAHTALGSKQDSPKPALLEELCQCAQLCAEGPGIASLPGHSQGPNQRAWGGTVGAFLGFRVYARPLSLLSRQGTDTPEQNKNKKPQTKTTKPQQLLEATVQGTEECCRQEGT